MSYFEAVESNLLIIGLMLLLSLSIFSTLAWYFGKKYKILNPTLAKATVSLGLSVWCLLSLQLVLPQWIQIYVSRNAAPPSVIQQPFRGQSSNASVDTHSGQSSQIGDSNSGNRLENKSAESNASNSQVPQKSTANIMQQKADFLKTIESMTSGATPVSEQSRKSLFIYFADLFKASEDRLEYQKWIVKAFECQKLYFEDALVAKTTGKIQKSPERSQCEKDTGSFYNREKLVPAEIVVANQKNLESLAKDFSKNKNNHGNKSPASVASGLTEESIKSVISEHERRIQAVRNIFQ